MKFFTGDYFRDPGVRSVSLAARGLWMDMLCLMHQSARKGYLQHPSGLPFTPVQLARMVGYGVEEIAPVLQELDDSGVFSRTKDGVIYSRRMDRDARKSAACAEAGKKGGGNPALTSPLNVTYKGEVKGQSKGGVKPQSQSQNQNQTPAPPNPQGLADGGGNLSEKESFWRWACDLIGDPGVHKSRAQQDALYEAPVPSMEDRKLVERYHAVYREEPAKYPKPRQTVIGLITEFYPEVGKAKQALKMNGHVAKKPDALPADWSGFAAHLTAEFPHMEVQIRAWKTWTEAVRDLQSARDDYFMWRNK